jgi:hypothetical protein
MAMATIKNTGLRIISAKRDITRSKILLKNSYTGFGAGFW